jgi:hypothetical protein
MPFFKRRSICVVCRRSFIGSGDYCPEHRKKHVKEEHRESASSRGYDYQWRIMREKVLRAHGIPRLEWSQYDVDHNPPYNAEVEPDHRKYQLVPRKHREHSTKTVEQDMRRDEKGRFLPKG